MLVKLNSHENILVILAVCVLFSIQNLIHCYVKFAYTKNLIMSIQYLWQELLYQNNVRESSVFGYLLLNITKQLLKLKYEWNS